LATNEDRRWLAAANDCLGLYGARSGQFAVATEDDQKFRACYPLAMHALNQVRAGMTLVGAEVVYPAIANARVAFEHALTAQWVMLTRDGAQRLLRDLRHHDRYTLRDFGKWADLPHQFRDYLNERLTDGDQLPTVQAICDRFAGNTKNAYAVYRSLTGGGHPSAATLLRHIDLDPDGEIVRLKAGSGTEMPTDLALALGWSAVMAAYVLEGLRQGKPHLNRVRAIARIAGLVADLAAVDSQPDLEPAPPLW
jgi:hypothetical protein